MRFDDTRTWYVFLPGASSRSGKFCSARLIIDQMPSKAGADETGAEKVRPENSSGFGGDTFSAVWGGESHPTNMPQTARKIAILKTTHLFFRKNIISDNPSGFFVFHAFWIQKIS